MAKFGRFSIIPIVVVLVLCVFGYFSFIGNDSPSVATESFLEALARANVDKLTDLTYMKGKSPDDIKKKWEYTMTEVAPYYHFTWQIDSAANASPEEAAVKIKVIRNVGAGPANPEDYQVPLVKDGGHWKVVVTGLSREMFPGLPRY